MMSDFLEEHEKIAYENFLNNGYIIQKIDDISNLDFLQNFLVKKSSEFLSSKKITDNKISVNPVFHKKGFFFVSSSFFSF